MNSVRGVIKHPYGKLPPQSKESLCNAETFLFATLGLFLTSLIGQLDFRSLPDFGTSFVSLNYILLFAWYVAIRKILQNEASHDATHTDILLASGLLILNIIFISVNNKFSTGLLVFILGSYIFKKYKSERHLHIASIALLAISGNIFFSPLFYQLALPELIHADAFLLGNLLKIIRPDISWSGAGFQAPDGRTVSLVGACSSFQNISLAALACVAVIIHKRNFLVMKDFFTIVIVALLMILLNDIRLILCVWSKESYAYWHDGNGAGIYQNAANLVIVLTAIWGSRIGHSN